MCGQRSFAVCVNFLLFIPLNFGNHMIARCAVISLAKGGLLQTLSVATLLSCAVEVKLPAYMANGKQTKRTDCSNKESQNDPS